MAPVENNNRIKINTRATVIGRGLLLLEDGELLWMEEDAGVAWTSARMDSKVVTLNCLFCRCRRHSTGYFCKEEEGSLAGGCRNFP